MNRSDQINDLAAALVKAHAEIGGVAKGSVNPFFKSKYASLEAVIDAVKAALLKQQIVAVQGVHAAENGVAIETMLLHTSGQWISSILELPASKEDAQGYGSAITYGKRYGLQAMCWLPSEDDDANAAVATAPFKKAHSPTDGCFDALDKKEQEQAREIALSICDHWSKERELAAYEAYYQQGYSNEMLLGVWELLKPHSEIRNKLKKMHGETTKKAA